MYLDVISSLTTGMKRHFMKFVSFVWLNLDIANSFVTLNKKDMTNERTLANGWHQGF
jgi:hypothetical protein